MPVNYAALYAGPTGGIAQDAIRGGQAAGFYSAEGSPLIRAQLRRHAARQMRNRRRSAQVLGQIAGLDRMGRQQFLADQGAAAHEDAAGLLDRGFLEDLQSGRDFSRGIFSGGLDFERDQYNRSQEREEAKRQRRAQLLGDIGSTIGALGSGGLSYLTRRRREEE